MVNVQMDSKRAGNFTAGERAHLVELVQKYMHIIENKKSDAVTVTQKTDAWQQVMIDFNAVSERRRSAQQLKQVLLC